MTARTTRHSEPAEYVLTLPPPPTTKPNLADWTHRPGSPVLDRVSVLTHLANHGPSGSAIAVGDVVRQPEKLGDLPLSVSEVDHQTGQITVTYGIDDENLLILAGVDVEVVARAYQPDVPDDFLEGKTLEQARTEMALIASDYGRYPHLGGNHFDGWVFGRVLRDIRFRDYPDAYVPIDFPAGQRVLVRTDDRERFPDSGPHTYTAFSTRRMRGGAQIAVWPSAIQLEA